MITYTYAEDNELVLCSCSATKKEGRPKISVISKINISSMS